MPAFRYFERFVSRGQVPSYLGSPANTSSRIPPAAAALSQYSCIDFPLPLGPEWAMAQPSSQVAPILVSVSVMPAALSCCVFMCLTVRPRATLAIGALVASPSNWFCFLGLVTCGWIPPSLLLFLLFSWPVFACNCLSVFFLLLGSRRGFRVGWLCSRILRRRVRICSTLFF